MYTEIKNCRISKESDLVDVFSLGFQALTGVFPSDETIDVPEGPVDLVYSPSSGLLQLRQTYSSSMMYGDNYGYRSGLNSSMVNHLELKAKKLQRIFAKYLTPNDIILDIGSNDGTSLRFYPNDYRKIGIDPTGFKFMQFYDEKSELISDFFSSEVYFKNFSEKAKIITSVAMFYDLPDPMQFASDIYEVLDENGLWHFEQSYMPAMIDAISYDTLCHEHLEFYSFTVVFNLLDKVGFKVVDIEFNDINGGSFALTVCKKACQRYSSPKELVSWVLGQENLKGVNSLEYYLNWALRCSKHRDSLKLLLKSLKNDGKVIYGYGASTKGNVLLQYCSIDTSILDMIVEINEDKFGKFTPGTKIPIVSEDSIQNLPDYFLVLPWHFKSHILSKMNHLRLKGVKFIFPFPSIEIL